MCVINILKVKNRMRKYIAQFMVLLFVFSYANAMEITKQDPSVSSDGVCYLNKMPKDVRNHIAFFLGWEIQEACIKRTREHPSNNDKVLDYCSVISFDKKKEAKLGQRSCAEIIVSNIRNKKRIPLVLNMPLLGRYQFTSLAFNQQGTYLLVRCLYAPLEKDLISRKRIFFSLYDIVTYEKRGSDKDANKKEENILQEYLMHHVVCKNNIFLF